MKVNNLFIVTFPLIIIIFGCSPSNPSTPVVDEFDTKVSDSIMVDTIWDFSHSPYIVTGDITIENGVTLTIQPNVEVRVEGFYGIIVRGVLIVDGAANNPQPIADNRQLTANPIIFTSNLPYPELSAWKGIKFGNTNDDKSILRCAVIEYAEIGINCFSSSPKISDCIIRNNETGIYCQDVLSSINHNLIHDNVDGIVTVHWLLDMTKNTIVRNENGIVVYSWFQSKQNNIFDNSAYSVLSKGHYKHDIDLRENWWGTVDADFIAQQIYDKDDNHNVGGVLYTPFAKSLITDAYPRFCFDLESFQ